MTIKPPIQVASPGSFEAVLSLELVKSERKKCVYIRWMAGVLGIGTLTIMTFGRTYFESIGDKSGARFLFVAIPLFIALYETLTMRILDRCIAAGLPRPRWLGLLSAVLEPSAISIWLLMEGFIFQPGAMFYSPISFIYATTILMSSLHLSGRLCVVSGLVAASEYLALAAWQSPMIRETFHDNAFAFFPVHGVRAIILVSTGLAAAFVATQIRKGIEQALQTLKERDFVLGIFGRYLTDEVVDDILRSPEGLLLGGKRRTVTLMMTDLRGFSTLSERLPPESVIAVLNNCLAAMTEVIVRHRGTIDEFIGDAIMVIFGAPIAADDDAERAVACAIEMELAMDEVNRWNAANGLPHLEMGIGIHTGQVVVGNIGSEKRSKYGVVGSAVNLTSRIESYTVGGQIYVSEATAEAIGPRLRVAARRTVQPKGVADPIEILDVRGLDGIDTAESPAGAHLPEIADPLHKLDTPLPVRFVVFEEKDTAGPLLDGAITELSRRGARLRSDFPLEQLSNLRLHLSRPNGERVLGNLIAKVTGGAAPDYEIRFTAIDTGVQDFLKTLLPGS